VRAEMMRPTPLVEPLSIDEAFLDLSGTQDLHGAFPAQLLATLARRVEDALAITVSIGLSDNKSSPSSPPTSTSRAALRF
jgi:DNA polymerase IV